MGKINASLVAINKFFYYAMNYPCVKFEYKSIDGTMKYDYLPDFFKAFEGEGYMLEHLRGKWHHACNKVDSYGYLMKFYAELDGTYRKKMLAYIMENYNDEIRLTL